MIYNPAYRELKTDEGKLLKKLDCPLNKQWDRLQVIPEDASKRHCHSCMKAVFNLAGKSDEEVEQLLKSSPQCCVYVPANAANVQFEEHYVEKSPDPCPFRRILTARGEKAINQATTKGFWPLVKPVKRSWKFAPRSSAIYQNEETGHIITHYDWRWPPTKPWKRIVKSYSYEPYPFEHPIAAYLLPTDLIIGERVFLVDLIENLIGEWHNGTPFRLESAYAIWKGEDFKIEWNELIHPKHHHYIG